MKFFRILFPLVITILVLTLTEVFKLTGLALIGCWIIGLILAISGTTVIEVIIRMRAIRQDNEEKESKK